MYPKRVSGLGWTSHCAQSHRDVLRVSLEDVLRTNRLSCAQGPTQIVGHVKVKILSRFIE